MNFSDYASLYKIKLLKDDRIWLAKCLFSIPKHQRIELLKDYVQIWCEARDSCNNPIRADNEGRRSANKYIMEYLKCNAAE